MWFSLTALCRQLHADGDGGVRIRTKTKEMQNSNPHPAIEFTGEFGSLSPSLSINYPIGHCDAKMGKG